MARSPLEHQGRSFKLFLTLGPPTCGCHLSTVPSWTLPVVSSSNHASTMPCVFLYVCKCITVDVSIKYDIVLSL